MKKIFHNKTVKLIITITLLLLAPSLFAAAATCNATGPITDLGDVACRITSSFAAIAKLITGAAFISGLGFAMAAVMKFKAHRDNPQQIPIGTPIALLFVASALIFTPSLFSVAGQTIFGSGAKAGVATGLATITLQS